LGYELFIVTGAYKGIKRGKSEQKGNLSPSLTCVSSWELKATPKIYHFFRSIYNQCSLQKEKHTQPPHICLEGKKKRLKGIY